MGSAEFVLILVPIILVVFAVTWARKKAEKDSYDIGMAWYYFYADVRLPLGLVVGLLMLIQVKSLALLLLIILIGLQIAVIIGLSKKTLWGWNANMLLLIAECICYSIIAAKGVMAKAVASAIVMALLWFVPNFIYFKKRIQLFR